MRAWSMLIGEEGVVVPIAALLVAVIGECVDVRCCGVRCRRCEVREGCCCERETIDEGPGQRAEKACRWEAVALLEVAECSIGLDCQTGSFRDPVSRDRTLQVGSRAR